jgi:hypothetical protein
MQYLLFFSILLCSVFSAAAQPWTLSSQGYGPVRPGMTPAQAAQLMGTEFRTFENRPVDKECDYLYPRRGHNGVSVMVQNGKITHLKVTKNKNISTKSGVRVGDTAKKLKELFGQSLEIEGHKYVDNGDYFYVWEKNMKYGVKFEVIDGVVRSIYVGDESIRLVEGCS